MANPFKILVFAFLSAAIALAQAKLPAVPAETKIQLLVEEKRLDAAEIQRLKIQVRVLEDQLNSAFKAKYEEAMKKHGCEASTDDFSCAPAPVQASPASPSVQPAKK